MRKSTPPYVIYAELGVAPAEIHIKTCMISVINSENTKFSKLVYKIMLKESNLGNNFKWINSIKGILIAVGKT